MPKLEPKDIQKQLKGGVVWPVYWLYGPERMISRELFQQIRRTVLGEELSVADSSFREDVLDGNEAGAGRIVESAQSLSLMGGSRLIVVRDAHAVKEPDLLAELLGPSAKKEDVPSVCVFLSKDLDRRRKFSKLLEEKAAVVGCDEVAEDKREQWIAYLANRRGLTLEPELVLQLRSLDPWTLDVVDGELAKYELLLLNPAGENPAAVISGGSAQAGADGFCEAFFSRNLRDSLQLASDFAESPEESIPLLGLVAWNARFLALVLTDRDRGTRHVKISPFQADKLTRWGKRWRLDEALELQKSLEEVDYGVKQTPKLPLGLWTSLVTRYGR